MRVFMSRSDAPISEMFKKMGHTIVNSFDNESEIDLMVFPGGVDIHPFLYGEKKISSTKCHFPTDMIDVANWKKVSPDFPKLGICRGAQLGNILSGGRLWQDVTGHQSQPHEVQVSLKGETYLARVNSSHHQQCILTKQATPLAMARCTKKRIGPEIYQDLKVNEWEDPEAFYYEHTNFLGIQWHPEWGVGETSQFSVFKVLFDVFLPEDEHKSAGDF